uniref:Uncharacterized protein n=1 Tax=Panagrolaimus sp. PS1159 TaxID=55785 RepID=A0AC35F9Y7_9BILA
METNITYRAKSVETLVIFSFNGKINETEGQTVTSYIDYLNNLVTVGGNYTKFFDQDKISLNLFFGNYNATSLLNAADDENNTIAFIILKNNQEFTDNVTQEANDTSLSSATTCNETLHLCNVIKRFLEKPRDLLTKLNLVIISNICPEKSIFEEFSLYNVGESLTRTFLITKAKNKEKCGINKPLLTKQFTLDTDYNKVDEEDRKELIDPTFGKIV